MQCWDCRSTYMAVQAVMAPMTGTARMGPQINNHHYTDWVAEHTKLGEQRSVGKGAVEALESASHRGSDDHSVGLTGARGDSWAGSASLGCFGTVGRSDWLRSLVSINMIIKRMFFVCFERFERYSPYCLKIWRHSPDLKNRLFVWPQVSRVRRLWGTQSHPSGVWRGSHSGQGWESALKTSYNLELHSLCDRTAEEKAIFQ